MNEEVKAQWVAALRSGEYKQGKGALRTRDGEYCCLGVLCDLAVKAGATKTRGVTDNEGNTLFGGGGEGERADLPPGSVRLWAGLSNPNPTVAGVDHDGFPVAYELSTFNDEVGFTFSQIADLIEAQL